MIFDDKRVTISEKTTGKIHITGGKCPETGLYNVSLLQQDLRNETLMTEIKSPESNSVANVYECSSKNSLVNYHHALCWSSTKSGWVKEIGKISLNIGLV